jgi:hypothetical protein
VGTLAKSESRDRVAFLPKIAFIPMPPMKKVIDASALRTPALRAYLAASPANFAVLPEMAALESFKGDAANNLKRSLEIVGAFPRQILVLKPNEEIVKLDPRRKGLRDVAGMPVQPCPRRPLARQ